MQTSSTDASVQSRVAILVTTRGWLRSATEELQRVSRSAVWTREMSQGPRISDSPWLMPWICVSGGAHEISKCLMFDSICVISKGHVALKEVGHAWEEEVFAFTSGLDKR